MNRSNDPKAWLQEYLTEHGEQLRSDVVAAAADVGISERLLVQSATRAGVEYRSVHGPNLPRQTMWRLPDPA